MNTHEVVRAAIPTASDDLCSHILWGRTAFPFSPLSARDLYRAASAYRRASAKALTLCDMCHRLEEPGKWLCASCRAALKPRDASP
jgi:hypothetical protein